MKNNILLLVPALIMLNLGFFSQGCSKFDRKADQGNEDHETSTSPSSSGLSRISSVPPVPEPPLEPGEQSAPPHDPPQSVFNGAKILVFGDFGTGSKGQTTVAKSMVDLCANKKCELGLSVGDNIYPKGLESLLNGKVDYDQGKPDYNIIKDVFVHKYHELNIPIFMSIGNHDMGDIGGIKDKFKDIFNSQAYINKRTTALMMNQISYSTHSDNPVLTDIRGREKRLWNFPDQFYSIKEQAEVHLWAIDTNAYPHRVLDEQHQVDPKSDNFKQKLWLDEQLSQSTASWKIVFGHFPLYSHGKHGWHDPWVINSFRSSIINTLCEHKVDFYLAGHEHMLEIDQHRCDNGHLLTAVMTGAAAKGSKVQSLSFPFVGPDENLLWANGRHYAGDKSIYKDDEPVLGFAYLDISDPKHAKLHMKLSQGASGDIQDGCFEIIKGDSITQTPCE